MALRDFDRVRERWELHLERRHLVHAGLALTLVVGGAFYGGWRLAVTQPPPARPAPAAVAAARVSPLPLPSPGHLNDFRVPVLPTPVAAGARARVLAERRAAPLAPMLEEAARGIGRAAVASDRHEQRPRMDQAETDTEHIVAAELPPGMLGALPSLPAAPERKTAKTIARREAFADRRHADGTHGEVPAEFVQSRPPLGDVWSQDPALTRGDLAPSLGLASGVDATGAALQTPVDAGGFSAGQPDDGRSAATIDVRAREALVAAHLRRVEDAQRRKDAAIAAAQRAAEQLRLEQIAQAAAVRAAKLAALQAAEQAELKRVADAKRARAETAAKLAAAKAAAKQLAEQKRAATAAKLAAAKAAAKRLAEQKLAARAQRLALAKQKTLAAQRALMAARTAAKALAANQNDPAKQEAATTAATRLANKRAKAAVAEKRGRSITADTRMYWVQIKSLKGGDEAKAFAASLRTKGYTLTVSLAQVTGMGAFHRVRLGPFRGQAAAKAALLAFQKREHMEAMIMSASPGH